MKVVLSAAVAVLALTASLSAQDFTEPPSFGSVNLTAGFIPDPHSRNLTAGGALRASDLNPACRGTIANAPDYSVYYVAGSQDLFINVDSDRDTTLVVNGPDGSWYCDDDGAEEALNPLLHWEKPQSGRYDIWVGTYQSASGVPATLFISEIGEHVRQAAPAPTAPGVNISAPAVYGNVELRGGYLPDPHRVSMTAGGPLMARDVILADCRGWVTRAPSIQLNYTGSGPLHIYTVGETDTTLAINRPNGEWVCADDTLGTDAGMTFENGVSGVYDIYVGTYSITPNSTTLMISEIQLGYVPAGK